MRQAEDKSGLAEKICVGVIIGAISIGTIVMGWVDCNYKQQQKEYQTTTRSYDGK